MPILYFLLLFIVSSYPTRQQPTVKVDLLMIAGKTRSEMEATFGPVTREEQLPEENTTCLCKWVYFMKDKLAIVFIDGKADWVVAYQPLEIINRDKTRVMSYTNFRVKVLLRLTHMKGDACCDAL